jgi:uncharacterized tellurite resistance protein B-like protein
MESTTLLEGYSDLEKGAYLGAIASIASADRQATEEEMAHLTDLCEAAGLAEDKRELVLRAAIELSGAELNRCLDVLKNSELKHSLIADMILFAKADGQYGPEEQAGVEQIAQYLGLNQEQFSLLNQFTDKAAASQAAPEEKASPSFLSSLGMDSSMKAAGINTNGLFKGLLGIAGPMILSGMLSRALGGRRRGGGMFGGGMMGGGLLGGGMLGGLGSLIGMLGGGRGFGQTRRGGLFGL